MQSISTELIPEHNHYGIQRSGCYVLNEDILNIYNAPVAVPLKHIDYQLQICNTIAKVVLQQIYINPTDKYLELEYSIPIDPKVCIYKFNATFGDTTIEGIVKEKEQATREYQKSIKEGKKAALGFIDQKSEDIMHLKIGNVPPKQEIKLKIEYLHQLNVAQNMFWKILLQSKIWPRYINDKWREQVIKQNKLATQLPQYTWCFKVTLITTQTIVMAQSLTHKMTKIQQSSNLTEMIFVMEKQEKPSKDFSFIYSTNASHKPTSVLSKTDTSQTLLVSFIPQFNNLAISDAEKMEREGKDYEVSLAFCKGQFVFLLDRSGSMRNQRIQKAKSALIFFLKSLPIDSLFNIISFGGSYQSLYKESVKTTTEITQKTIEIINSFDSNMGGTEIEAPLSYALNQKQTRNYPKHIFLLTDGDVNNTKVILDLIKRQSKFSTVHGIGIGNGCSRALIQGCSEQSRGRSIFISDEQEPSQKIIQLLDQVLTPVITNFKLQFNSEVVQSVIPNPQELPYILKNDPVNLYFFLKPDYSGDFQLTIQYTHPITQTVELQNLNISIPSQPNLQFLDKKAQYNKLKLLSQSLNRNYIFSQIMMAKPEDLKEYIIKQSIKHQVLCPQTAFLCVQKNESDSQREQVIGIGRLKVEVPQMIEEPNSIRWAMFEQRKKKLLQLKKTRFDCSESVQQEKIYLPKFEQSEPQSHLDLLRSRLKNRFKAINKFEDSDDQSLITRPKLEDTVSNKVIQPLQQRSLEEQLRARLQTRHKEQKNEVSLFDQQLDLQTVIELQCFKPSVEIRNKPTETAKPKSKLFDDSDSDDDIFKSDNKTGQKLVSIQAASGNWNSLKDKQEITRLLAIPNLKLKQAILKYKDEDWIFTLLVVRFLESKNQTRYKLVIKKAKQWIQIKSKELSLTQQDIQEVYNMIYS